MDLELIVENLNSLSQQVSVLQEYIQLKFGEYLNKEKVRICCYFYGFKLN